MAEPPERAGNLTPFQLDLLRLIAVEHQSAVAIWGGIGCGKTVGLAWLAYFILSMRPGCTLLFGMDNAASLHLITLPACRAVFGHAAKWLASRSVFSFENGSRLILRYYDVTSTQDESQNPWEGIDAHGVIVDEAQKLPSSVYVHATQRARQMARDVNGGKHPPFVVVNGRPCAVDWWTMAVADAGGVVLRPKTSENPHIDPEYEARLRATMSPAEFLSVTTGSPMPAKDVVYDDWSEESWPRGNVLDGWQFDPAARVVAAIDFGRRHPAVLFIQTAVVDGQALDVVFAELMPDNTMTEELARRINLVAAEYRLDEAVVDPAGVAKSPGAAGAIISDVNLMQRSPHAADMPGIGVPIYYTTDATKRVVTTGVQRVRRLILTGDGARRFVCSRQLWESGARSSGRSFARAVRGYRWGPDGQPLKDKHGQHDHCMDALRYFVLRYRWALDPATYSPPRVLPSTRPAPLRSGGRGGRLNSKLGPR